MGFRPRPGFQTLPWRNVWRNSMTTERPSFLIEPELSGFDIYRQEKYADIVVRLAQDYVTDTSDPDDVRSYLDAYVADRDLTEAEADDIYEMIVGGLPVDSNGGGDLPDPLFIPDGLIGGITSWIVGNAHRRQPAMALFMSVAIVAIVAARKVFAKNGGHFNLYHIVTAPSGSGKDGPRQAAIELLAYANGDKLLGPESVTSATSIINLLRECPAVLLLIDEVGKFVSSIKNKNAGNHEREIETLLLKAWSSANNRKFFHKGFADIKDNAEVCMPNVNFFGTSVFESVYGDGAIDLANVIDGFLSRCITYDAGSTVPPLLNPEKKEPPAAIVDPLAAWIKFKPAGELGWLIDPQPKVTAFDDDAERAFRAATVRWDILADRLPAEHGASIFRRCPEKARKYAMVYAISEALPDDDIVVRKKHADWAIAIMSWLTQRTLWTVKHKVAASAREQQMVRILEFIKSKGSAGATASDVCRKFRDIGPKVREELIRDMALCGDIVENEVLTGGRTKKTLLSRDHAKEGLHSTDASLAV